MHSFWRGLAVIAVGVHSSDDDLCVGVATNKEAIDEIDLRSALPKEMARHERAIHHQSFALQPLVPLAAFAERQCIPSSGKTIADAVNFFGEALADPESIKAYTPEEQLIGGEGKDFYDFAEIYSSYYPTLPEAVAQGLEQPSFAARIRGSLTVIDSYVPLPAP